MPAYEVPVRFVTNDKQLERAMERADAALGKVGTAYAEAQVQQKKMLGAETRLIASSKKLVRQQVDALVKQGKIPKAVKETVTQYIRYQEQLKDLAREEKALAAVQGKSAKQQKRFAKVTTEVIRYREELKALRNQLGLAIAQEERFTKAGVKAGKGLSKGMADASKNGMGLVGVLNNVSFKLFVVTFAAKQVFDTLLRGFVQVGEEVILFEQRIRALTGSTAAIQPLYDVVNRLGVRIADAGAAFSRFAVANRTMGRTQAELVKMTETVLAFGQAGGGAVQEVTAGLQQLGQSLASNSLQGDELRSVLENLPLLAAALADELAGGSIAALRDMGSAGKLTGKLVSEALLKAHAAAVELAEGLPDTTTKALNRVSNAWDLFIASVLNAFGGTSGITGGFNALAERINGFARTVRQNQELVSDALSAMKAAFLGFLTIFAGQQLLIAGKAMYTLFASLKSGATAASLFTAAINPALAVAVGLAVGAFVLFNRSLEDSRLQTDAARAAVDTYAASIRDFKAGELRGELSDLNRAYEAQTEALVAHARKLTEIKELEREVAAARARGTETSATERFFGADAERKAQDLAAAIEALRLKTIDHARDQGKMTREMGETVEKIKSVNEGLEKYESAAADAAKRSKEIAEGMKAASKQTEEFNKVLASLDKQFAARQKYEKTIDAIWATVDASSNGAEALRTFGLAERALATDLAGITDQFTGGQVQIDAYTDGIVAATAAVQGVTSGLQAQGDRLRENAPLVKSAAHEFKVLEATLLAVYQMENRFGKIGSSRDKAGNVIAVGGMQFRPETMKTVINQMKALGIATHTVAEGATQQNAALRLGAFHMADLGSEGKKLHQILIGYHNGAGDANKAFKELGPNAQNYVRTGIKLIEQYAKVTGESGAVAGEIAEAYEFMDGKTTDLIKTQRDATKAQEDLNAARLKGADIERGGLANLEKYIVSLKVQGEQLKLTKAEAAAFTAESKLLNEVRGFEIKQQAAATRGNVDAIDAYTKLIKAYKDAVPEAKKLAAANEEVRRTTALTVKTVDELWSGTLTELAKNIQNTLAGAFNDLFSGALTSAKDFFDSLFDVFRTSLANLAAAVLQNKIIIPIVGALIPGAGGAVAQAATGVAGAAGGGGGGFGSSVLGIGKTIASAFSPSAVTIGQTFSKLGNTAAGAFNNAFGTSLGNPFASASAVPNLAFSAGGLLGGVGGGLLSNALFGGKGYSGIGGSIGGAGGSTAGMAIGSAFGPIGTIAGGLLGGLLGGAGGGLLGSLFGGEKKEKPLALLDFKRGHFTVEGTRDIPQEGVDEIRKAMSTQNEALKSLARILGSDTEKALQRIGRSGGAQYLYPDQIENWMEKTFNDAIRQLVESTGSGTALGEDLQRVYHENKGDLEQLAAALEQTIQVFEAIGQIAGELASTDVGKLLKITDSEQGIEQLSKYGEMVRNSGEALGDAILRMTAEVSTFMGAVELTGTKLFLGPDSVVRVADEMAEAAGGVQALQTQMTAYYEEFYSEEEKRAEVIKAAQDTIKSGLDGFNITIPQTRTQFRELLEGLDLNNSWKRDLFNALLTLTPQFDYLFDAAEAAETALGDVAEEIDEVAAATLALRASLGELAKQIRGDTGPQVDFAATSGALTGAGYQGDFSQASVAAFLDSLAALDDAGGDAARAILDLSEVIDASLSAFRALREFLSPDTSDAQALQLYVDTMEDWLGMVPQTKEALLALIDAGRFTAEQLEILAKNTTLLGQAANEAARLGQLFENLKDSLRPDFTGADALNLYIDTMNRWIGEVPASKAALLELIEAGAFSTEQVRALAAHVTELGQAFEYAKQKAQEKVQEEYEAEVARINANYEAQQKALSRQLEAQTTSYNLQITAAGEFVSEMSSLVGLLRGAVGSFGEVRADIIDMEFARASRRLAVFADAATLPALADVEAVVASLQANVGNVKYGTAREEAVANSRIRADLEKLASKAEGQLTTAEYQIEILESQLTRLNETNSRQLEALAISRDQQLAQAAEWREEQLAALELQTAALISIEGLVSGSGPVGSSGPVGGTGAPSTPLPGDSPIASELKALRVEVTRDREDSQVRWDLLAAWGTRMYTSTRNQELTTDKWDKNGIPLEVEDTAGASILALGGQ